MKYIWVIAKIYICLGDFYVQTKGVLKAYLKNSWHLNIQMSAIFLIINMIVNIFNGCLEVRFAGQIHTKAFENLLING